MKSSGPDGHPTEDGRREEGDFPIWITPITCFWGICGNCHFSDQLGCRIFELTGEEDDLTKAQRFFSGSMQKHLSVINDKSIAGGNQAKDTLEKAGDRGCELRAPESAPVPPAGESETDASPEPAIRAAPTVAPLTNGAAQQKLEQLDQETKRWMGLDGIPELTGLPNPAMLSRVLLPGIFRQTGAKRQPLGCIFLSPEGMAKSTGNWGDHWVTSCSRNSPSASRSRSEKASAWPMSRA